MHVEKTSNYFPICLTSALVEGGWSIPRPGHFTPWKEICYPFYIRLVGLHCQSGWMRKYHPPPRIRSSNITKYFVVTRQLQGIPFLRVHSNTLRFYIVDSYLCVNNTKGTQCSVSMATIVTRNRYSITLYIPCLSCCVYNTSTLTLKRIFKVEGFMLVNQCYCAFEPFTLRETHSAMNMIPVIRTQLYVRVRREVIFFYRSLIRHNDKYTA